MVGENVEVKIMDEMIRSLPDNLKEDKEFCFGLSVQFAQSLLNYVNDYYFTGKLTMQVGDEFIWKGKKCKVL